MRETEQLEAVRPVKLRRTRGFSLLGRGRVATIVHRWRPPNWSRPLLASMQAFQDCRRTHLLRIARWGEVVEAHPGEVLIREDHTDHWFYVILAGSVLLTKDGEEIARRRRREHFGEDAIVGFSPQRHTVTAVEPTVLFVIGRRYFVSIMATLPAVQRAIFPTVEPDEYRAYVRTLREDGRRAWEDLRPRYLPGAEDRPVVQALKRRGRRLTWNEALEVLRHHDDQTPNGEASPPLLPDPVRLGAIPMAVAGLVMLLLAFLFHPPFAVVTPGEPFDVVADISVTGVAVDLPNGRYLLLSAKIDRPSLAGMAVARVQRRTIVRANSPEALGLDPEAVRDQGREAFVNSHTQAIEVAEAQLRVDPSGLTVAINDRGLAGPSGGLIYALALVDMLDATDLAAGRRIAATGELREDGEVAPVGFIAIKAQAAYEAGADVFLVPRGQEEAARHPGLQVIGVRSLKTAVAALQQDVSADRRSR